LRCIPALERLGADSRVSLWMAANNPGFAAYVRQDQPNQFDCFNLEQCELNERRTPHTVSEGVTMRMQACP
jgi:hypothetical protein